MIGGFFPLLLGFFLGVVTTAVETTAPPLPVVFFELIWLVVIDYEIVQQGYWMTVSISFQFRCCERSGERDEKERKKKQPSETEGSGSLEI